MKKNILMIMLVGFTGLLQAQVGIGNAVPHSGAILDLNNTDQKGLALPVISAPTADTIGLIYFDASDSIIKYNEGANGYNGLSPWKYKYNGSISSDTYYQQGGNVGIGISAPLGKLSVANGAPVVLNATQGHVLIGTPTGGGYTTFLSIDDDEVMAHDGSVAPVLNLQKSGGTVAAGGNITAANYNSNVDDPALGVNGPVPSGGIIMWSGTIASIPAGWHLCDGTAGTPSLVDRFIVCSGSAYATHDTGGNISSAHDHTVDPDNFTTIAGGSHTHSMGGPSGGSEECDDFAGGGGFDCSAAGHTHTITNSTHTHTFDLPSKTSSGASNTENRPPYYALAFIMKL